jgi:hypothetical protein
MKLCIKFISIALLLLTPLAYATGGYDNGTPAGRGNVDIDVTINPGDLYNGGPRRLYDKGQSYLVWGYGITDRLDFHGYVSHEAMGVNQIYYGLMYNFFSNDSLDLSSAFGARHRLERVDAIFPQLLYTFKLPENYEIAGSLTNVYNTDVRKNIGNSFDVALRIPVQKGRNSSAFKNVKISIGLFKSTSNQWNPISWYPTYSVDMKF